MTPSEKDAAVLAVLNETSAPLGPTEIARRIGQDWCCTGHYGNSAPIVPVLRRIGAVRWKGGKYTKPVPKAQPA